MIVVAGYVGRFDRKFLVMRLNTDGTPDEEFGGDGSKRTNIGPFEDEAGSAVVQRDGKIVVVGLAFIRPTVGRSAVARYLG